MDTQEPQKRSYHSALWGYWRSFLAFTEATLAFKTALAATLSMLMGIAFGKLYDRPDLFVGGLWSAMASIVVMQVMLGSTYKAAWIRFLGVVVGSIAGAILIHVLGSTALALAISIFATIVACSLLRIKDSFRIAGLSTAVIIIMGGAHPDVSPMMFSFYRFVDSCLGIIVAVVVAQLVWPERALENIRKNMLQTVNLMSKYYLLATNLEEPSMPDHAQAGSALAASIEELIQESRNFSQEAQSEIFENRLKLEQHVVLSDQLDILFSAIVSLYNVKKTTLASIFDDDLASAVSDATDKTQAALLDIEKALTSGGSASSIESLAAALDRLNGELSRFRATRTTRKFSLDDVENFYVFFYSLRIIGEAVMKMAQTMR